MELTALASHLRRITVGLANGAGGVGSGVIWAPGVIVTNAHVVRSSRIGVRGADGTIIESVPRDVSLIDAPFVSGGMKPKLRAVETALAGGVAHVCVGRTVFGGGA